MAIDISQRVDVTVSLGTSPIATASFDSVAFLANITDVALPDAYRVYTTYTEVLKDFADTSDVAKFAQLALGGNFRARSLYVVKYGATNATPLTPVQALTNLIATDDQAYWVGCDSHVEADVTGLVALCEAEYKMFVTSTQDAGTINPADATDIGSVLQDAAYNHVITLYHTAADANLPEGGIVGAMAAIPAGTSTLEDKTLIGVPAINISATARTALEGKNVGYYSTIAGVNSYFNSKVASGQFADTIIFSDWLRARIAESVYGLLKRASDSGKKVRFDDVGFAQIRQAIFQPINEGISNGAISEEVPPVVRIPSREEVAEADRANRILPNVVVEVLYSNVVHKVLVRAYVSI